MSDTRYIPQLDGIRAIAALMVMYFHFFQAYPLSGSTTAQLIQKTSIFGQTGVALFFVLSGFLITRILLVTKKQPFYFKNFYAKRTLRIFPLYFAFLALYYFIILPWSSAGHATNQDKLIFVTYLQNIFMTFSSQMPIGPSHFWSLAVEEHFYLFWPFLVFLTNDKHLLKWLFGLICLSISTRILLVLNGYEVFYFTFSRLDDISLGAVLAIFYIRRPSALLYFKGQKILIILFLYLVVVLSLWYFTSGKGTMIIQITKYLLIGLLFMVILGYSISNNSIVTKCLSNGIFSYLGKISYGLYVFHPVCYLVANKYLNSSNLILNLALHFSLTIVISALSYELFESKILRLKKYFSP